MIELNRILPTASMQDTKNRTAAVTKNGSGPAILMNRTTLQAVIFSTEQWNAIVRDAGRNHCITGRVSYRNRAKLGRNH